MKDVNSWRRVTHKSHENWATTNCNDSTVFCFWLYIITKTTNFDLYLQIFPQFSARVTLIYGTIYLRISSKVLLSSVLSRQQKCNLYILCLMFSASFLHLWISLALINVYSFFYRCKNETVIMSWQCMLLNCSQPFDIYLIVTIYGHFYNKLLNSVAKKSSDNIKCFLYCFSNQRQDERLK